MADPKSQITVVEQVYHQLLGGQPHLIDSRFSRELESDEQPYERRLNVGVDSKLLDCGWIEEASQLLILNEEGRNLQIQPTDAERQELQRKVLEVRMGDCGGNCWLVPPGESMRACPGSLHAIWVRSRFGGIHFTLHLLPK